MKKILITGITGMVGSHLADYIYSNTNWIIHGLIRCRSSLENLDIVIKKSANNNFKRLKFHYGDLEEELSIDNLIKDIKPDIIFHLAAQSFPKTSFEMPLDTYKTNIIGTQILLEKVKKYSKKSIVHVCSSSEVFGRVPKDKIPIKEDNLFHPASPYAISKIGTDIIGRYFFEAYGLKVLITRMFTHTGPRRGDVFAESSFAKQIAMIERGIIKPTVYVGNLNSLRTIADVRDAVRAYYLLVTKKPKFGEVYNIGGNFSCTIGEILNFLISKSTKKKIIKIEIDKNRVRPLDADLQIPDISKFKNHTGWKPQIKFEKTMLDLLDYWRKKVNSKRTFINR